MIDPAAVMRAIGEVRDALERWQAAAKDAFSTASDEHRSASVVVAGGSTSAIGARARADDLEGELSEFESSIRRLQGELAQAAAVVEARAHLHQQLTDHVANTHAVWREHLDRAEADHAAAEAQLDHARSGEAAASDRLGLARAGFRRARSDEERAAAQRDVVSAEREHDIALAKYRQAEAWEREQQDRVARCTAALGNAEQADEAMKVAASHVSHACASIRDGPAATAGVDAAIDSARDHLGAMEQAADEAMIHAGRAAEHLATATQHLHQAEDGQQRGQLLAMDAALDLSDQMQELRAVDTPTGGAAADVSAGIARSGARPAGVLARTQPQTSEDVARARLAARWGLDAYRESENMPPAGSPGKQHTAARLDVPGTEPIYGKNAHQLEITMGVNAQTRTHAEAQVFQEAMNRRLQAERVILYVDRELCDSCGIYGGIGTMLRKVGISAVEVVAPDGRFLISADRPSVPRRIGDSL